MKLFKIILFCIVLIIPFMAVHANNPDSIAYQLQRKKINGLLAQRSKKFDQYTQSLDQHTGIFGWQTKKDIKRSGDILMDMVRTDNDIFKELKILFDYKNFQQTQVQQHSNESESEIAGYMMTINKLRKLNELQLAEEKEQEHEFNIRQAYYLGAILVLLITSVYYFSRRKRVKRR